MVVLLAAADRRSDIAGHWSFMDVMFYSTVCLASTWERQMAMEFPRPVRPDGLPEKAMEAAQLVKRLGKLNLYPGRIPVPAGRKKARTGRGAGTRKTTDHFRRHKSAGEVKKKKGLHGVDVNLEFGADDDAEDSADSNDNEGENDDSVNEDDELSDSDLEQVENGDELSDFGNDDEEEGTALAKGYVTAPSSLFEQIQISNGGKATAKPRALAVCSTCGGDDHRWPTCRKRDIELILSQLGQCEQGVQDSKGQAICILRFNI
jgi:hypothetical protein